MRLAPGVAQPAQLDIRSTSCAGAYVPQASAADNGQCLVHDVTAFKSNGIVDGLVNDVAAANISESEKTPDPVKALVWHGASLLLVGTEQGKSSAPG